MIILKLIGVLASLLLASFAASKLSKSNPGIFVKILAVVLAIAIFAIYFYGVIEKYNHSVYLSIFIGVILGSYDKDRKINDEEF